MRLRQSQEANDREAILAAVRLNWRLWTIIQSELLDPRCPLPAEIRSNVLSLANFVDKHSVEVIARPEAGKLDVLVSVNRELAAGLLTDPAAEATSDDDASAFPAGQAVGKRPSEAPPVSGSVDPLTVKIST